MKSNILSKTWFWLLIICIVGVVLRVAMPAHAVFANETVNFIGKDSYYQMNLIRHVYEGTLNTNVSTLYPQSIIWLAQGLSAGHADLDFITIVAVFVPIILAVGVILFVYIIGRRLFSPMAGLIAAAFAAVWPNEFFTRSMLGAVDYHAVEVFLTTGVACIFFVIVTQKKIFNWKTLAGLGVIAALIIAYTNVWGVGISHFLDWIKTGTTQATEILATTKEAVTLLYARNPMPVVDSIMAVVGGYILIRRGIGWRRWLLVTWTAVLVAATCYQIRFDYYLAVPLALLVGFVLVRVIRYCQKEAENAPHT